jgi:hypothetical protein
MLMSDADLPTDAASHVSAPGRVWASRIFRQRESGASWTVFVPIDDFSVFRLRCDL